MRSELEALRAGLRDLGWVERRNIVIETRWAGSDAQRQRDLAAHLKALPVALRQSDRNIGGALVVVTDSMFVRRRADIAAQALRARVPTVFGRREYVEVGGLMSYSASSTWHWRSAASFVDKILRGAKPADIPVEQPTKFELVINMRTAKALGINIPQSLLRFADEVIEWSANVCLRRPGVTLSGRLLPNEIGGGPAVPGQMRSCRIAVHRGR